MKHHHEVRKAAAAAKPPPVLDRAALEALAATYPPLHEPPAQVRWLNLTKE